AGAEALWCDPVLGDPPPDLAEIPRVAHPAAALAEAVVLGTPHRAFDLAALARAAPLVFDPFGLLPAEGGAGVRVV
ncbi:hypothetical protein, partial [Roseomonas rosulenta]|uniref:hypothetical protein n=1 Tax=Roseomonas rosulenta TaxID=2748667 RepID=UPI0018E04EF2